MIRLITLIALVVATGCQGSQSGSSSNSDPSTSAPPVELIEWEDTDCENDATFFEEKLWEPELSVSCLGCHEQHGIANHTRLVFVPPTSDQAREHNQAALWNMATILEGDTSLLLLKPTNTAAETHTGGELVRLGSPVYEALWYWVGRANGRLQCDGSPTDPATDPDPTPIDETPSTITAGPQLLRRLSHAEFRKSLEAILGDSVDEAENLPADNVVDGYTNNAHALTVSPLLGEKYNAIAEQIADDIVSRSAWLSTCNPITDNTAQCAAAEIRAWGKQLFRRPMSDDELSRYFNFWYDIASEDGFNEGMKWTLTTLFQSPHFLYRSELGYHQGAGTYGLSAHEVASQLSYTLAGTPPDEALMAAADNGTLLQPATLESHSQRLLQSQGARDQFWSFMQAWLGLDQLPLVVRSFDVYPELTWIIRRDMAGQVQRLAQNSFESNASLTNLFTTSTSWVTDELAEFYGVPTSAATPDAEGFKEITLPETYGGGLLSTGAILTTHALSDSSSPIHRGLLVRERMLCHELPPPPENLDTSPPEMDPNLSTRERYSQHSTDAACSGCHRLVDPIGFAFEHFDGIGRYRAADGPHPIDDSGEIVASIQTDGPIEGVAGLSTHLSTSQEVRDCFIQQWTTYLWGLSEEPTLESSLHHLSETFGENNQQLQSAVAGLTHLPHFTERVGDADVPVTMAPVGESPLNWQDLLGNRLEPNPGPAGETPGLQIDVDPYDSWGTGGCTTVTLTNTSDTPITWEVAVDLGGTLDNIWSAEVVGQSGSEAHVVGVAWNATLNSGATTEFGFCVSY